LRGLKKRLQESAATYDEATQKVRELTAAGKDSTNEVNKAKKANLEFRRVLLDIIGEFPELLSMQGGLDLFWMSMEGGIGGVSSALDTLVAKMYEFNAMMAALENAKFLASLTAAIGLEAFTEEEVASEGKRIRAEEFNKLSSQEQKRYSYKGSGWYYPSTETVMSGPLYDYLTKFMQAPGRESISGEDWRNVPEFDAEGAMKILAENIGDMEKYELEGFIKALKDESYIREMAGGKPIDVENILGLIGEKQWREAYAEILAEGLSGGEPPPGGGDGKGKAAKFAVPELKEFNQMLAQMRADFELEMSAQKFKMIEAGEDELLIEKAINDIKLEQVGIEKTAYDNYIASLIAKKEEIGQLEQTEDTLKNIKTIDETIMKLRVDMVGVQVKTNELLTEEELIIIKMAELDAKIFKERLASTAGWRKKLEEALQLTNKLRDTEKELATIRKVGAAVGDTNYEIVQQQLQYVDRQIEGMVRVLDSIDILFGSLGNWMVDWLKKPLKEVLQGFLDLKTDLQSAIDTLDEEKRKGEIYESTKESVESALVDALLSGDVKDAIEAFADLLKQAVAEKLAAQIADKLVGFVNAFSVLQGGGTKPAATRGAGQTVSAAGGVATGAAGAAGASGAAATLGWIGVGLMAASFLGGLFGGKDKIDEMDTKLNYILRGGGYQLPSSFLLPEDEGEFSLRRRGKDGFNVKFPKRSLEINITHKFEWEPAALAKAVASDMSAGAMSSIKQYSLTGGE